MDTHITGPRGSTAKGAIVSAVGASVLFSDPQQSGHDLFRTAGATTKNPLLVRGTGQLLTAFNGAGASLKIVSTKLDGSDQQDFLTTAAPSKTEVITADRIYQVLFAPGTSPTAGAAAFFIEVVGKGLPDTDFIG